MDRNEALEIMEAVRSKVPEADRIALDAEYASRFMEAAPAAGSVALDGVLSETALPTPETPPTPEAPVVTSESLLATLDTALTTYMSQLDVANAARADVKGRRHDKPALLEAANQDDIRAEVEALAADPVVLAELQAEADYFTANPEKDSPAVGFDIVIVPEGLTDTDEQAIARDVQAKITTQYSPYVRDSRYNDRRTPEVTGKGYRIAFAPRHYNVPSDTTKNQTKWMDAVNGLSGATELQTATDAEALAQINNLQAVGELNDPNTRFHTSYFRRFDQAPVGLVSYVCVFGGGRLFLD